MLSLCQALGDGGEPGHAPVPGSASQWGWPQSCLHPLFLGRSLSHLARCGRCSSSLGWESCSADGRQQRARLPQVVESFSGQGVDTEPMTAGLWNANRLFLRSACTSLPRILPPGSVALHGTVGQQGTGSVPAAHPRSPHYLPFHRETHGPGTPREEPALPLLPSWASGLRRLQVCCA